MPYRSSDRSLARRAVWAWAACAPALLLLSWVASALPTIVAAQTSVRCWGSNSTGQCNVPALPAGLDYVEVSAGRYHTVARCSNGSVVAWGDNGWGQCNVPALPTGLTYVEIAGGYSHTAARRSDGSVVAWGSNTYGQCNVPALPAGLTYVDVAAGRDHTVALRNDGSIVAWGNNQYGQCNVPVPPAGLTGVEVSAGGTHTAARYELIVNSSYCTAGTTTNGCSATTAAAGTPSASASSGFTIAVNGVEGQQQGMSFYGLDNTGFTPLAWGSSTSFMCVKSPLNRVSTQNSGGSYGNCEGALAFDWNAYRAANPLALGQPFFAGQHVYAQGWFRDPPSPKTTLLSDALEFVVQP